MTLFVAEHITMLNYPRGFENGIASSQD